MPVTFRFVETARFVVVASGEVTLSEMLGLFDDIELHPGMKSSPEMLVDTRGIRRLPTVRELRTAATAMKPIVDKGFGAMAVVATDPWIYGVSRMYAVFAEFIGANVGSFETFDEAEAWLNACRKTAVPRGKTTGR
jgi:hypothetical protein